MTTFRVALLSLTLSCGGVCSAGPVQEASRAIADAIDSHVTGALRINQMPPSPRSDDAEFLRRITLDVIGRIPNVAETRAFLADQRPDRRERLIEHLITSHGFVNQLAQVYRAAWVPQATTNLRTQYLGHSMEAWIAHRLRENICYDALVRDLLSAPLEYLEQQSDGPSPSRSTLSATAFYQAGDLKAETVTGNLSRLFLGFRMECAQCHD